MCGEESAFLRARGETLNMKTQRAQRKTTEKTWGKGEENGGRPGKRGETDGKEKKREEKCKISMNHKKEGEKDTRRRDAKRKQRRDDSFKTFARLHTCFWSLPPAKLGLNMFLCIEFVFALKQAQRKGNLREFGRTNKQQEQERKRE